MLELPTRAEAPRSCDHTQPFRFAEWNYFFGRSWNPPADDLFNHRNYSRSAVRVREKWAYVFRNVGGTVSIHRELWIDAAGDIHGTPPSRTKRAAKERGDTRESGGAYRYYNLDFFDERGRRVDGYHVLYSRHRLPLPALLALEQARAAGTSATAFSLLRECLRWTSRAPSSRGVYEYERCEDDPTLRPVEKFLTIAGEPCVVGFDLLEIGLRLSNAYREELHAFQVRYVQPTRTHRREFDREALARTVHDLVSGSTELADRVKEHLRWTELLAYLRERRTERARLLAAYEQAAARVCRVLDNPLYEILRSAHHFDEERPDQEHVGGAAVFAQVYARTLSELACSAAGTVYVVQQVDELLAGTRDPMAAWGGPGDHYLKRYLFPDAPTSEQVFKTTRLVAKSIMSLFTTFVGAVMSRRRQTTTVEIAAHLAHVFRHGKGFTFGALVYQEAEGVKFLTQKIEYDAWYHGADGKLARFEETIHIISTADKERLFEFERQAQDAKSFLKQTKLAGIALDTVNVCIALNALRQKLSNDVTMDWGREALDASAHALNLTKSVIEHTGGETLQKSLASKLTVVSIVTSAYFIGTDLYDADKASDIHDYDVAYAYIGAAVGEAIAVVGLLIVLKSAAAGTTAGPVGTVLGVLGGLVGAVGYIVAGWRKDTPIETMMKHCEWGTNAYEQPDDYIVYTWHGPWSFAQWEGRPELQLAALNNLVGQFSVETYKHDVEGSILKASNPPAIVRFTQVFEDTSLVVRASGTMEHPDGRTVDLGTASETVEPGRLLRLMRRSIEAGKPFHMVRYPDRTTDTVRKYHAEGYRVKDLRVSAEVFLRGKQSVGTASASCYRDGEIRDFNRGISTHGSYDPHM